MTEMLENRKNNTNKFDHEKTYNIYELFTRYLSSC